MLVGAVVVALGCDRSTPAAATASPPPPPPGTAVAGAADLCVTSGALRSSGDGLTVESPEFRATLARSGDTDAELRFTYLGPTSGVAQLGSGQVRHQLGLKLRAQDPCNLVYAMWRIDPGPARSKRADPNANDGPELVVQVKRNLLQHTSAECKNGGYRTVRPLRSAQVAAVVDGSTHVLRASLRGTSLDVWADGVLAWQGTLGDDALGIDGPVGLRSDNARFTFTLSATGGDGQARRCESAAARTGAAAPQTPGGGQGE
jgi:hypothetical protein